MDPNSQTTSATALELCSSLPYFSEESLPVPTIQDVSSDLAIVSDKLVPGKYTTFQLFPLLPSELRLLIWEAARPASRFLKLYCERCGRPWLESNTDVCPDHTHHIRSKAPVPSLLHACIDSRTVALKWYRLSFGHAQWSPKVYFDWAQDGLYTHCSEAHTHGCYHNAFPSYLQQYEQAELKRLTFKGPCGLNWAPWESAPLQLVGLKDVYFIAATSTKVNIAAGRRDAFEEKDLRVSEEPLEWFERESLMESYDMWYRAMSHFSHPHPVGFPKHEWRTLQRVNFVRRSGNTCTRIK